MGQSASTREIYITI
jgi:hypothetical protein